MSYIKEATDAMVNLNLFATIEAMIENGLLRGEIKAAEQIRLICLKEKQRQLRIYDNAVARIKD